MPRVALTFDDGPGPQTAEILDILREANMRATFFVMGRNIEEAPWAGGDAELARSIVMRALREGHVVGNHTWSHARPDEYLGLAEEIVRTDELIRTLRRAAAHGSKGTPAPEAPIPFRLPYGVRLVEMTVPVSTGTINVVQLDPRLPVIASLGRAHVHWTSDFEDWALPAIDGSDLAHRMADHVEKNAEIGLDAVIDLHDGGTGSSWGYGRPATATGVRMFLAEAKRRGWETFTVPL